MCTAELTYDACPKNSESGSFRIMAYHYVSKSVAAADSTSTVRKKVQRFNI